MKPLLIITILAAFTFQAYGQSRGLYDNYIQSNSTSVPKYQGYTSDDFDRMLEMKRRAADREDRRIAGLIQNTIATYNQAPHYPDYLANGYYNIILTNNTDFCEDAKVYVLNNQITILYLQDGREIPLAFSGKVSKAKGLIKLDIESLTNMYFHTYFIETLYSE